MRRLGSWLKWKPKEGRAMWILMMTVLALGLLVAKAVAEEEQKLARIAEQVQPRRTLLISLADRKLALIEDGRVVKIYAVAVGAASTPSPAGRFLVVNRLTDPTYYRPGKVIAPGPENPLGTRWIGLDRKGYGIHGTNEPRSVGRAVSHGCIRMAKRDMEELFDMVRPGDRVEIRGERDAQVAAIFGGTTPVVVATTAQPATVGGAH